MRGDGVRRLLGQAQGAQRLGGDGPVAREVVFGLLGVEVVAEAGEAPDVGVLPEAHGQGAHDGLGGQHVAPQVLVGHAVLHLGQHGRTVERHAAQALLDLVQDRRRAGVLAGARHVDLAVRGEDGDLVLVGADADALGEDVVEDQQVDALGGLLGAGAVEARAGLGGEADAEQARARRRARMSTVRTSSSVRLSRSPRSILPSSSSLGRKSATAAAMTSTSASRTASATAAAISSALSTCTTS